MTPVHDATSARPAPWNPPVRVLVLISGSAALVLFLLLGVQQVVGISTAHTSFPRARVPGATQLPLRKGPAYVWVETSPKYPVQPGSMRVEVFSETTGDAIAIRPATYRPRFETARRPSTLVGEITIPKSGTYIVNGTGGGGNVVVIGKLNEPVLAAWAIVWFALAGISLAVALTAAVIVVLQRNSEQPDHETPTDSRLT